MNTNTETIEKFSLSERFNTLEELKQWIGKGVIHIDKKGYIFFNKSDYVLKNDTSFYHTGYSYKAEDDMYLSRKGVAREKIFPAGTIVFLKYNMWSNSIDYELNIGDYRHLIRRKITNEERFAELESNKRFVPVNVEYNCIGIFTVGC